jgi:hypothetical protein
LVALGWLEGIEKGRQGKFKITHLSTNVPVRLVHLHQTETTKFEVWRAEFFNADGRLGWQRYEMISNNGKGGKATLILDDRTCVWQGRKIVCLGLIGCIAKGAGMGSRFSSVVLVSVWFTSFRYVPRWIFFDIGDASPNAQLGASSAKDPKRSKLASFLLFSFSCFVF